MKKMISIKEASKQSGLSEWELKRGIHAGEYPHIRIGEGRGKYLLDMDMLQETLQRKLQQSINNEPKQENLVPFRVRKVN